MLIYDKKNIVRCLFHPDRVPTLGMIISGRNNNFDLVRLLAAIMVLWGHAPFVSPESFYHPDPILWISGNRESSGSIAVETFFFISGILISSSMERNRTSERFLISRFARLWPGYIVCIAAMVYIIAPITSHIPVFDHSHLRDAGACLRANLFFPLYGVCDSIPGAFPNSPIKEIFGFPYWTLVTETHCYAMVLVSGILMQGCLTITSTRRAVFLIATALLSVITFILYLNPPGRESLLQQDVTLQGGYSVLPVFFFLAGMVAYAIRHRIKISTVWAIFFVALSMLPGIPVYLGYFALVYGILAVVASKSLRTLSPRYDLSFGIYIYGAGMQQVVVAITGPAPPWMNFVGSALLSSVCAYISWRFVESPSMRAAQTMLRSAPKISGFAPDFARALGMK